MEMVQFSGYRYLVFQEDCADRGGGAPISLDICSGYCIL